MSDSKLHPLIEPFQLNATARWREREDFLHAMFELRDNAAEILMCLEKAPRSEHDLAQASSALKDMEEVIRRMWPERKANP